MADKADAFALMRTGDHVAATSILSDIINTDANDSEAWHAMGFCSMHLGRIKEATTALARSCQLNASRPEPWVNLASSQQLAGRWNEARESYQRAMALVPTWHPVHSNYLLNLHYDPEVSAQEIADAHVQWGKSVPSVSRPFYGNDRNAERALRVGFVSADFREHAATQFIEPLLQYLRNENTQLYLYSEYPHTDSINERFRGMADKWMETARVPSGEVAKQIHSDQVDILIDLAGHTGHNRLDVFGFMPAPIQMSYFGYPYPTGLPAIDYWIGDSALIQLGEQLPGKMIELKGHFATFQAPEIEQASGPLPSAKNGFITFGSVLNAKKVNDKVLTTWKLILDGVPDSKLLLLRSTNTSDFATFFEQRAGSFGIGKEQLEIRQIPAKADEYLSRLPDMDVMLDTFPFGGHTITCEALWMGVPVVTLMGDRPSGRLSSSVLAAMKLPDLIGNNEADYVEKAIQLANKPARRHQLRMNLRSLMKEHIANGSDMAKRFATGLRKCWETWCHQK